VPGNGVRVEVGARAEKNDNEQTIKEAFMRQHYLNWRLAIAVVAAGGTLAAAHSAMAEVSLKGKRVQLIIASSAGGGTDRVGRLVGQYMEKYLPGNPTIVIRNMGSGGGKIRAANYLMNKAKADGTTFMQSDGTVISPGTLRRRSARYDPRKFEFIGSVNRGGAVMFINKKAHKRLKDKSQKPVIVAAISGTRSWQAMPMWGAEFFGWNVRWIPGYRGVGGMSKALRQGEIDVFATNNAYIINQLRNDGVIDLLVQDGQVIDGKVGPRPSFKEVPVFADMLKKAKIEKLSWQGFQSMTQPSRVDKWMGLPPGTPKEFVKVYRAAYKKSVHDPKFLEIGRKQFSKEINYIDGATVAKMVDAVIGAPAAAVDYAENMKKKYGLAAFKKKKKKKKKKAKGS
jgi:tripartite-type tricarboxylate transporter receptor subunit TctC